MTNALLRAAIPLLLACAADAQPAPRLTPSGDPAPIPTVKLVSPTAWGGDRVRTFFGRVAARETTDLSFEVGGRLVELPIVEGQTLKEGALVAALDREPFERAVRRAELELERTERELDRATQLARANVAAEVRAEDALTARDLAEVALTDAKEALKDAALTAPFEALVAERLAPAFSNVTPGQPVARLHDMSEVRVEIDVPERLLQSVPDPGDIDFAARVPGLDEPVPLTLREFEAQTGAVGQSFQVTLALPDLGVATLIPGASLTVEATAHTGDASLSLPPSAILAEADGSAHVFVYEPGEDGTGTLARRPVELASPTGTDFVVTGIEPGTEVVGAGVHLVSDGQQVRPFTGLRVGE